MKYGRWTVVSEGKLKHICRCDCGTVKEVNRYNLAAGKTTSCGCHRNEATGAAAKANLTVHGMKRSPEYKAWRSMRARCNVPGTASYETYGGRGIRVCEKWDQSFPAFYEDLGPRPSPAHSIDRIDVNGHYEPGNCRWATITEQNRNRRSNRVIEVFGERLLLVEAAEKYGLGKHTLKARLDRQGLSPEEAVTMPLQHPSTRVSSKPS